MSPAPTWILENHPHGVLVGLIANCEPVPPAWVLELLHPEERRWCESQPPLRSATYALGRAAMRLALQSLGLGQDQAVLSSERGAPLLPAGLAGSISHKKLPGGEGYVAVALASKTDPRARSVGVDVELLEPARPSITDLVLTPREKSLLRDLGEEDHWRSVVSRFSIKESVYKAIDRYLSRYVGFEEAEIDRPGLLIPDLELSKVSVRMFLRDRQRSPVLEGTLQLMPSRSDLVLTTATASSAQLEPTGS